MTVKATVSLLSLLLNTATATSSFSAPIIDPMSLAKKVDTDVVNVSYDWNLQQRLQKDQLAQKCGHVTSYTNAMNDRNCDD